MTVTMSVSSSTSDGEMKTNGHSPSTAVRRVRRGAHSVTQFLPCSAGDGAVQYRQLDAECGGRVVDDQPPPGSVRSGPRSGGDDPAHVLVQPLCRSIGRY